VLHISSVAFERGQNSHAANMKHEGNEYDIVNTDRLEVIILPLTVRINIGLAYVQLENKLYEKL